MQIRLTVLGPRSAHPGRSGHHPAPASAPHALMGAVDVLVTAPVGTALASVASGLADAVAAAGYESGGGSGSGGAVVLYAGGERLDPQRCALGEPPLVDGAVLSLHAPADPDSGHYPGYPGLPETAVADATVHLDVVAGPDAGGVHLLHGGQVRIGRSADADVPLDDPDVSRLHCAVTVAEDGRVTIADLGSTNGTAADGVPVGTHPVPLEPGALLRIGESALRLRVPSATSAFPSAPSRLPVHADGEGHLRVTPAGDHPTHAEGPWTGAPQSAPTHSTEGAWTRPGHHPGTGWTRVAQPGDEAHSASRPYDGGAGTGPRDPRRGEEGWGSGEGAPSGARGAGTGARGGAGGQGHRDGDGWGPGTGPTGARGTSTGTPGGAGGQGHRDGDGWGPGTGPTGARGTSTGTPGGAGAQGHRDGDGWGPGTGPTGARGTSPGTPGGAGTRGHREDDNWGPDTGPTGARGTGAGAPGGAGAHGHRDDGWRPGAGAAAGAGGRGSGHESQDGQGDHWPTGGTVSPGGSPYGAAGAGRRGERPRDEGQGETSRRGRDPQGPSAPGDQPYDDPSTTPTRRGERIPRPGAAGHGPAGQPERSAQDRPGTGGSGGGQPGQGPRPTDTRSPGATPRGGQPHGQDRGETPERTYPGDSPYGGAGAGRGRQGEGDAGYGATPRGGQPYGQGRGDTDGRGRRPQRPWSAGNQPADASPGGSPYGSADSGPGGSPYDSVDADHSRHHDGDADSGRQPGPGGGYGATRRGGQPYGQGPSATGGQPADAAYQGAPYDGPSAASGQRTPYPGGQPGAGPRGGHSSADPGHAGQGGAPADSGQRERPQAGGSGAGGPGRRGAGDRTHAGAYALDAPGAQARRRGIGAWVRQLAGGKSAERGEVRQDGDARGAAERAAAEAEVLQRRWPDPATVLMTALGPGSRLWERAQGHPDALTVRLGSADQLAADGGLPAAAPVTVDLRQCGSLGLAGPRARVAGLARSVVAQLAALHSPATLEIVLISGEERLAEWSWLGWLPQVQPLRGQDCRLLLAYDGEQATARTDELTRRLEDGPLGPGWASASPAAAASAAARHVGPRTVVVVDGAPGPAALNDTLARLAVTGSAAGIHLLSLAEAPAASPTSPLPMSYEAACAASAAFAASGVAAVLSGDVATGLQIVHGDRDGDASGIAGVTGVSGLTGATGATTTVTVDAVSAAWAERFARALAPLRPAASAQGGAFGGSDGPPTVPLPDSARLLDELGLARATPASLLARWAAAADEVPAGGRALAVLGAGPRGALAVDLAADGPHALIDGTAGTGKTELLRSFAASLAAAERPDRLELILIDGAGAGAGAGAGEGLRVCTDLPHVSTHLAATDPVRMREFAQALSSELKRRAELLDRLDFTAWHARPHHGDGKGGGGGGGDGAADPGGTPSTPSTPSSTPGAPGPGSARVVAPRPPGDIDPPPSDTLHTLNLRAQRTASAAAAAAAARPRPFLPRLVVLVDDFDALVAPALGSPGRPAAGSVVRALEAIARDGARLGVHLVVTSGRPDRTADTVAAERAGLRIVLDPRPLNPAHPTAAAHPTAPNQPTHRHGEPERPDTAPATSPRSVTSTPAAAAAPGGDPAPGRGRLFRPEDAGGTPFQAGRVTGRIPRTATQRPTVVPLEWRRMGDPPTRRPLRELGNGPTDLALLASALQRAAQSADAPTAPALI
ncbi:FtsK/SpoIIIE domain-containing protein [Streptomyces violaceusniger]|uniref:FtsK/SpoIIIE domain-containing protein n=1 Tax=Streptomyces violaceusniger TaxID=68280 RepID=UPI00099803A2|nr:FtsK/SpoIIIE domain-containing protein [Streptomyces hygroscopicus]